MLRTFFSIAAVLSVCCAPAAAQVDFRKATLAEALEQARAEDKLVFLDAFTEWCGPCRMMDRDIFPQQEVYPFINEKFVSVKFDMERGEGVELAKRYDVNSFPTYLILQSDGTLAHRLIGASATPSEFMERLTAAYGVATQTREIEAEYNADSADLEVAVRYLQALKAAGDRARAEEVMDRLMVALSEDEKCSPELWFIYEDDFLSGFGTANFDRVVLDREAFNAAIGREKVDRRIFDVLDRRLIDLIVMRDKSSSVGDVAAIAEYLKQNEVAGGERLNNHAALAVARLAGDPARMLDLLEVLAPAWNDAELSQMFFSLAQTIRHNEDRGERERLVALSRRLLERDDLDRFRVPLETFIKYELGEKATTTI
jgi:thiol-disulfide isomerase/thioredoxin